MFPSRSLKCSSFSKGLQPGPLYYVPIPLEIKKTALNVSCLIFNILLYHFGYNFNSFAYQLYIYKTLCRRLNSSAQITYNLFIITYGREWQKCIVRKGFRSISKSWIKLKRTVISYSIIIIELSIINKRTTTLLVRKKETCDFTNNEYLMGKQ